MRNITSTIIIPYVENVDERVKFLGVCVLEMDEIENKGSTLCWCVFVDT